MGPDAPTLRETAHNPGRRHGTFLCALVDKRESLATDLLQLSLQKIQESRIFATASLRSVLCLTLAGVLILGFSDAVAYSHIASREGRYFSADAAANMRILSEEQYDDDRGPKGYNPWLSYAWTLVSRDAMIASGTGRSLD